MAPAADDRPLGPPPPRLTGEEAAIWSRLAGLGPHLERRDAAALELLAGVLARAAELRGAYYEASDPDLRRALLNMLSSRQSQAAQLLAAMRLPPLHTLELG